MSIPINQPIKLTFLTYLDANKTTLADATAVFLDVELPDGTVVTFTLAGSQVVHDSTGTYHYDYTPPQAGHYTYQWRSTGTVTTASYPGTFDVVAEYGVGVVDLAIDVKPMLGIKATDASKDNLLQVYIDAASVWADFVADTIVPKTYVEVHSGGGPKIVLFHTPVIAVTEIIEYVGTTPYTLVVSELGGVSSPYSYSLDNPNMGLISRRWNTFVGNFVGGTDNIKVTYKAGRQSTPADIKLAVLMDIQGLFIGTQMGGRPAVGSASPDFDYSDGPSIPLSMFPRLKSMLASGARLPGIG